MYEKLPLVRNMKKSLMTGLPDARPMRMSWLMTPIGRSEAFSAFFNSCFRVRQNLATAEDDPQSPLPLTEDERPPGDLVAPWFIIGADHPEGGDAEPVDNSDDDSVDETTPPEQIQWDITDAEYVRMVFGDSEPKDDDAPL